MTNQFGLHIVKHLLRSGEGASGVDHRFGFLRCGEGVRIAKEVQSSDELLLSGVERILDQQVLSRRASHLGIKASDI